LRAIFLTPLVGAFLAFSVAGAAFAAEEHGSGREAKSCAYVHNRAVHGGASDILRERAKFASGECHARLERHPHFRHFAARPAHNEPSPVVFARLDVSRASESCSGNAASILCPGYQFIGLEY
jgi:hypothetical protein